MRRRDFIIFLASAMTAASAPRAQQKAMPVIGFLSVEAPAGALPAFRQGLSETGYVERQNVAIELRWAEGHPDRLTALAADLVGRKVDVITASGDAAVLAAKSATSTIPIVFFSGGDPVATGLVASLAQPGGNLTGIGMMVAQLMQKRVELLSELVPQARAIALPIDPNDPNAESFIGDVQIAAHAKALQLHILRASSESGIDNAFASLVQLHVDALVVAFFRQREQIVALTSRYAVPAIYTGRAFTAAGGLISYGPRLTDVLRKLGIYAGKILKGAKPADLPVELPTTFELVINLKTARALRLTVPQSVLARADEVIE
jgi:putative tryptophan/tyrosine transport system substrate-binding protein